MHVHFETRAAKPPVFKMTHELIAEAAGRHRPSADIHLTLGADLDDTTPLATATALVTSNDVIRDARFPIADLESKAPALRWIHIIGAGIEPLLPLDWLPRTVTLTNNSGVHAQKIGEYATMALLLLNARLPRMIGNQQRARWDQVFTSSIAGKTVAVIGLGDMGGAAARQAKRLGMKVLGVRRHAKPHRSADEVFDFRQLPKALERADFVLVAAPLTPETRGLLGRPMLAQVKRGSALINIGRAGIVDYDALCDALASGALSGAVLDVFEPEPLPRDSRLWHTPNLVVTPHCSSDDVERYMPLTLDLVFRNLERLIAGKPLKNRVDPRRGY
ncbi:MAG TPA: D-2-hydroxyacid dehydrogenase [Alphaproteobacteria bacterium]|nr:D-2-hydroxyacid dehydrogenase [Alphaproteobacteria bacterium]